MYVLDPLRRHRVRAAAVSPQDRRPGTGHGIEQLGDPLLERDPRHHRLRRDPVEDRDLPLGVHRRRPGRRDRRDRASSPAPRRRRRRRRAHPTRRRPRDGVGGRVRRREAHAAAPRGRKSARRAHVGDGGRSPVRWWEYVVLFAAVAASWAGVPVIGATALGLAGVAASQGKLNLALVIVVSTAAGEVGGLIGYAIGNRWGRELLERPGKHQAGRQRMDAAGRAGLRPVGSRRGVLHAGHRLGHGQDAARAVRPVESPRVAWPSRCRWPPARTGSAGSSPATTRALDVGTLLVGLAVGTLVTVRFVRHRRRSVAANTALSRVTGAVSEAGPGSVPR